METETSALTYLDDLFNKGRLDLLTVHDDLMIFFGLPPARADEILRKWRKKLKAGK